MEGNNLEYIAIFFTHAGAIKYNRWLSSQNIENKILPVPRKISSNCGIGVKFLCNRNIDSMITTDIEKICLCEGKEYKIVYSCE